jgi:hypothetical protein
VRGNEHATARRLEHDRRGGEFDDPTPLVTDLDEVADLNQSGDVVRGNEVLH